MRFDPNPLRICADRHYVWHDWFAWHPVKLGQREWCWLEWIQRRGEWIQRRGEWVYSTAPGPGRYVPCSPFWQWEYRDMPARRPPRCREVVITHTVKPNTSPATAANGDALGKPPATSD